MRLTLIHTEAETKWYHLRVLQLIKDYRESQKVRLNVEHRLILSMAPDYDKLPIVQKCEVRWCCLLKMRKRPMAPTA